MLRESITTTSTSLQPVITQAVEFDVTVAIIAFIAFLSVSSVVYAVRSRGGEDGWSMEDMNEEQSDVLTLIQEGDGEIKQKAISDKLEWSDAKTSRVTSELTEANAVTKVRKDRQNYLQIEDKNRSQ